ncbi:MAG: vWA domain-containing protein [Alphaproteobacteria bacterium]
MIEAGGHLADQIARFARLLRGAGIPVGTATVLDALAAAAAVGPRDRDDFYWALHSVCVTRRDQAEMFDQAFRLFWRFTPVAAEPGPPDLAAPVGEPKDEISPRLAEGLPAAPSPVPEETSEPPESDAAMTYSAREAFQRMDFEKMTAAEMREAKKAAAGIALDLAEIPTRRFRPDARGPRIDMRRSLRAMVRAGGGAIPLQRRAPATQRPALVVLCDISGSMSRYSRVLLHFLHAVSGDRDRVHVFLFGTRLTNVTRRLRHRDVDVALADVAETVRDWGGGTRIGRCLHDFNRNWSRRVLGQGAVALLISDGLDRDAGAGLEDEIARLHRSCRRLIWLNPLLRYAGFEAKSLGIKAILPHVDEFRPAHNLDSLTALARALSRPDNYRGGRTAA